MQRQKDAQATKRVDFVAKDDEEQVATGIVMVPYAVDLQGDWERPETIASLADQFGRLEAAGEAEGGVMHAAWPSDHISLDRNEVLDEATDIGGTTAPEGAWVQAWEFEDDELWELVADGILEGYSIGAVDVEWDGPMEQDELPEEVSVPDQIPEDEMVWELVDGLVREVSAVDIPAVPDAQILETKADAEKRLAEHLGNRDGFIEEALDRGHSEAEAERLWEYLNRAVDVEGAGEPGKQSVFARVGKAALSVFSGSDGGQQEAAAAKAAEPEPPEPDAEKEGRTLSKQNRESLFATIDASLDVLQDAGVEHGMTRFTDREDSSFDLSEHQARAWSADEQEDDEEPDEEEEEQATENAAGGDTPDEGGQTAAADMTDEPNEPENEAKDLAEKNAEQIDDLTDAVKSLTETVKAQNEETVPVRVGDEVVEVRESKARELLGEDGSEPTDPEDPVKSLQKDVEELTETLDRMKRQGGLSDQIEAGAGEDETDDDKLSALGEALS